MAMSTHKTLDHEVVMHVAGTCLCLHTQRAARALARIFDNALKQFSLLMALNRPEPPAVGELALFLAMDRTSLTAALKPLERRGLVKVSADESDRRSRRIEITSDGIALLRSAIPTWQETHALLDAALVGDTPDRLRADLAKIPPLVGQILPKD
jgi:DNA-binding MarR family transcriptional regulator